MAETAEAAGVHLPPGAAEHIAGQVAAVSSPDPRDVAMHSHPGDATPEPDRPETARPGDVWTTDDPHPTAYLCEPHPTGADRADPHPWMLIHPRVPAGGHHRFRTHDLPGGLRLAFRAGRTVSR